MKFVVVMEDWFNVVMIFVDDFGWFDIGCYGNDFVDILNIDWLVVWGICFIDFYVVGVVCFFMCCVF